MADLLPNGRPMSTSELGTQIPKTISININSIKLNIMKKMKFQHLLALVMAFTLILSSCTKEDVFQDNAPEAALAGNKTIDEAGPKAALSVQGCHVDGPIQSISSWIPDIQQAMNNCFSQTPGRCAALGNVTETHQKNYTFLVGSLFDDAGINSLIPLWGADAEHYIPQINKFSPAGAMWIIQSIHWSTPVLLQGGTQLSTTMTVTYRRLTCPVESVPWG